uniref:Matrix metalloproteinase-16 n=1 Tax=Cacopsylla melanoneura TaxID=428564 RepID=A0A8D8YNF7_9HEMI
MRVKTPVLSEHKIKARHKVSGGSYRQVSVLLVIVIFLVHCVSGSGSGNDDREDGTRRLNKRSPRLYDDDVQSYLSKFGYLAPSSGSQIGNLRTDSQLKEAVRNLQRFGNIPATGVMDKTTLALMEKPRCGLPDTPTPLDRRRRRRRYILEGRKWDHTDITWSLRTERIRNYDPGRIRAELQRSLDVWSKHSKLTFTEVNDDRADILVYFEKEDHQDGFPFDGPGKILAHAFFPGQGRGGDAHFDVDENWIVDDRKRSENEDGIRLYLVAKHEFGHSLGLSHSSVIGSLMFPWYKDEENSIEESWQLPDDDMFAIQYLYGAKEEKSWARIPYYNPAQDNTKPRRPDTHPHRPPPYEPPRTPATRNPNHFPDTPRKTPPHHFPTHDSPRYPGAKTPETPRRHPTTTDESPRRYPNGMPMTPDSPRRYPNIPRAEPRTTSTTQATTTVQRNPDERKPNTCDTNYDAIAVIRREVFVFKDKWMWRIGDAGVSPGYPVMINRLWGPLPANFTKIDAVYERMDNNIVFFIGRQYFVFDGARLLSGYPQPLSGLGLPDSLDHIDGAMVWGHNSQTYLFAGAQYWKLDDDTGQVEPDYPRDMATWRGVEYNIDDVFQWNDGATYFFKGKGYWKFNDKRMRVETPKQSPSAQFWMRCPPQPPEDYDESSATASAGNRHTSASVALLTALSIVLFAVLL